MGKIIGMVLVQVKQAKPDGYLCPHCKKSYKSATSLRVHVKKEHSDHLHDIPGEGDD